MKGLIVPKRKIRARVRLADSSVFDGALYAAMRRADGRPERIADRLNDSSEKFLPLALEDMHVLLKKSGIVTVELPDGQDEAERTPPEETARELCLRLGLLDGSNLEGRVYAVLPPVRARALDYLNEAAPPFVTLFAGGQVIMVNGDYVIAVSEMLERDEA